MAEASSSTAAGSPSFTGQRPEAGPLPVKRGEIGYSEAEVGSINDIHPPRTPEPALPARHPADVDVARHLSTNLSTAHNVPPSLRAPSIANPILTIPSIISANKPPKRAWFWKSNNSPSYGGIGLPTLLAFAIQILLSGLTITCWVFAVKAVARHATNDSGEMSPSAGNTTAIFVHVLFAVGLLGQLLFLERRVYRMRAQRYAYLHPGEILPTSRTNCAGDTNMAFAPWHRPPLPTYAATLTESGVGTGDVEDNLVAQPPPPAYGHTRGSTLLLTGFLSDNMRAQRPVFEQSSRPLSYRSTDGQWDEVQDAERARRLEHTLAALERPNRDS